MSFWWSYLILVSFGWTLLLLHYLYHLVTRNLVGHLFSCSYDYMQNSVSWCQIQQYLFFSGLSLRNMQITLMFLGHYSLWQISHAGSQKLVLLSDYLLYGFCRLHWVFDLEDKLLKTLQEDRWIIWLHLFHANLYHTIVSTLLSFSIIFGNDIWL